MARTDVTNDSPLLRAARQEPGPRVPVWFMRQAGRSLPEYLAVRGEGTILDAIAKPDLATEITLQPVRRYGVDGAILFSDIVTPVWVSGFGIDITPGVGPECEKPFRSSDDLHRLALFDPDEALAFQRTTVENLVAELEVPLIGFAGAPYTLAAYLIEGRPSKNHALVKTMMLTEPELWHRLMDRLADMAILTLQAQVDAGASAVQLFDSWAGDLHPDLYRSRVAPYSTRILQAVTGVPRFHFGVNTGELLDQMAQCGAEVVGVDWRTPLGTARARTGGTVALQGNLDPTLILAGWDAVRPEVDRVLADNGGHPGHIFNLGHGILPETDPDVVKQIVDHVHTVGRADGPTGAAPVDTAATVNAQGAVDD